MSLFSRRVDKQLEAYQRELVDTHYKEVENMYRQIRGWRHDYRNHIQVLKAFAAKGDMDAIRAYLDELDARHHGAGRRAHPREAQDVGARSLLHSRQSLR